MHIASRILARAMASSTEGVNVIAPLVPEWNETDDPPPAVHLYNDCQHGWVLQGEFPEGDDTIQFPAVVVFVQQVDYTTGVSRTQALASGDGRFVEGSVQMVVQLLLNDTQTERAAQYGERILRAIRGVVAVLDEPDHTELRAACGVQLDPSTSAKIGKSDAFTSASVISAGAVLVTYPIAFETVPLT